MHHLLWVGVGVLGRYVGGWKDNMRHGKGKVISSTGRCLYDGYWKEDKKVKAEDLDAPFPPTTTRNLSTTRTGMATTMKTTMKQEKKRGRSKEMLPAIMALLVVIIAVGVAVVYKQQSTVA